MISGGEVAGERKPVIRDNNNNNNNNNTTRTTLNRFPTKTCHTRNITHHKESATS
jgi:hypothetical protein